MRVLIVEDDLISRRLLQSNLEKWGHEVVAAQDGAEAWRLFEAGEFPIVISDWMMPEMDGVELVRRIRACRRPGYVYTILLTAKSQKEDLVQGMEAGADDFVTKPFDREELRVRVRAGERIIHLEQSLAEQNRALQEAQAALVQSEKLASLGQLAAGVAHEINNPIAYVTNNLAVLRRDVPEVMRVLNKYREAREILAQAVPDTAAEAARMEAEIDLEFIQQSLDRQLDKSLEGLQRVRDIVKNLRDFARLDEAEYKEADLNAALETTLEILHYEIRKKELQVETHFEELPPVLCHPGKINQVFLNLLMNAVQACEVAGRIAIRTGPNPPAPFPAREGGASDAQASAGDRGSPSLAGKGPGVRSVPTPSPTRDGGALDAEASAGDTGSPSLPGKGPGVRSVPTPSPTREEKALSAETSAEERAPPSLAGKGPGVRSVVIEIVDNGCGISPEHLPRIFDPFFTTKPVGQGTGLGLSVSYGIIRDHGGAIEVDSAPGRGSTFRVLLPARPPGPA